MGRLRETKARQTRGDDMETGVVGRGGGQERKQLADLKEVTRPWKARRAMGSARTRAERRTKELTAMDEEKGNGIRDLALLVDVVDVECAEAVDVNVAGEHG